MIRLKRFDAAKNLNRFYALRLSQNLFDEWVVLAEWGRVGSPGTVQEKIFPSAALAQAAMAKREAVKTRRGYRSAAPTFSIPGAQV